MSRRFTLEEQRAEVRREVAMRRRIYPRLVRDGRLEAATAERAVAILLAVLGSLDRLDALTPSGELGAEIEQPSRAGEPECSRR